MKKHLLIGSIAALLLAASTIVGFRYASDHSSAHAEQMQGVFVFVNSQPVDEFDYLGTVESRMHFSGSSQFTDVRDRLLADLKKKFPTANGAIFRFKTGAADQVDAVKFKD